MSGWDGKKLTNGSPILVFPMIPVCRVRLSVNLYENQKIHKHTHSISGSLPSNFPSNIPGKNPLRALLTSSFITLSSSTYNSYGFLLASLPPPNITRGFSPLGVGRGNQYSKPSLATHALFPSFSIGTEARKARTCPRVGIIA